MKSIIDSIKTKGKDIGRTYSFYSSEKKNVDEETNDTFDYDDKKRSKAKKGVFAESDATRKPIVDIERDADIKPLFTHFLDGTRHVYKVDDIEIDGRVYPVHAGQLVVGCCVREDREHFKKCLVKRKIVLALPKVFDLDGGSNSEEYLRLFVDYVNEELKKNEYVKQAALSLDNILLYDTQVDAIEERSSREAYKSRATAVIQAEMTDQEQIMVEELCKNNMLDDSNFLIKDGSLEYNPRFSNLQEGKRILALDNYKYVVGVSKSFDPELLRSYDDKKLSKTIAELKPFQRTKAYRYTQGTETPDFAVWYLRLRSEKNYSRETNFSDVVKCEMVIQEKGEVISTDLIDLISKNIINEAYPVCYGKDKRWANHLYPIHLTETFVKSQFINSDILLKLF